jgi:hypothetical protein
MPEDLEAILARVEEELGEDARAALAEAVGMDGDRAGGSGSDLPEDVNEAKEGEMKASGSGDGEGQGQGQETASPDDPITEAELEEALADIREDAITHEELAEVVSDLEESAQEALMDALPGLAEDVGQKMATGGRVDYTSEIGETFGGGRTATGLEAGRTPTGTGGTSQKMDADGSEAVDYTEEIAAAFGADE